MAKGHKAYGETVSLTYMRDPHLELDTRHQVYSDKAAARGRSIKSGE